jgi:hypothetical protein
MRPAGDLFVAHVATLRARNRCASVRKRHRRRIAADVRVPLRSFTGVVATEAFQQPPDWAAEGTDIRLVIFGCRWGDGK